MPAGATYNRLHDVIQYVTAFRGGYAGRSDHLYEFDLTKENRIVTDDEEIYLAHQHYKKNKKAYEAKLKKLSPEMQKFEILHHNRLKLEVRTPAGLKIDDYIEKHKEVSYVYDFGDNWEITFKLEEIVEDYYFGFPTLLDGAETAPPEDVGGMDGFYDFMDIYQNPQHPEHGRAKAWAKSQHFREYDPEHINHMLKSLKYKTTEWDKVNHKNHVIVEDKYRKI